MNFVYRLVTCQNPYSSTDSVVHIIAKIVVKCRLHFSTRFRTTYIHFFQSTGIAIKAQIKDLSVFMRQRNPSLHHSGCSASEVEWNVQIIERILEWIKQQGKIPFVLGDIFPGKRIPTVSCLSICFPR